MKLEYDNEGQLFDTRYSKIEDVRRVQEALRKGDGIEKVYSSMGFDKKYARQIIRYLRYREWHIYDAEIIEFEEWIEQGEPQQ